ncbi:MAG: NADH-quinone oxidoreductase subunit NuoE [Actinomycetales bacterium]|nr:NADH-quinone oxidoreductase subunit NuoE [Actinomycetales bacterium]
MSEQWTAEDYSRIRRDAETIRARYPDHPRSALGPMLHLVQSEDGFVSPRGIALCAEVLDLSRAEVSAVATFYSQYRRHPNGVYNVGVCTNPLCGVMGGEMIWDAVSEHLGVGHDETTADGLITLERLECNAACDYAPVVMVNWEFFDHQTPSSTIALVEDIRAGADIHPTRGADRVYTFKEVSRVLAGFEDGHANEGPSAGDPSLLGQRIADERGWEAPHEEAPAPSGDTTAAGAPEVGGVHSSAERPVTTPADAKPETVEKPETDAPDADDQTKEARK